MKLIILQCVLLVTVCYATTIRGPCSRPPKGYERIFEKCIGDNLDDELLTKFSENPFIDLPEVKKSKVCLLEEFNFLENGKLSVTGIESFLDEWVVNENAREHIKKIGKEFAELANQQDNTLDVAQVFFNAVLAAENEKHHLMNQIC